MISSSSLWTKSGEILSNSSPMKQLIHDLIEEILLRLPPKSLLRFKSVSIQWKSTIESPFFQHKHLTHHRQKSKNPNHLVLTSMENTEPFPTLESIITLELESSISNNIQIPWENNHYIFCQNSCDGLICLYNDYDSVIIFNPTARWFRTLPPSTYQQKSIMFRNRTLNPLGFGKDEITGLYKPIWLYNSFEYELANPTRCEVFDFNINAWRFIQPSSPHRIPFCYCPVYLNGLLYWLMEEKYGEIKTVLSLDLNTETFEIVCKTPFKNIGLLFNLNDNLCGLDAIEDIAVIWSLNLEKKTWKKLYNIDSLKICPFFQECYCAIWPVGFMGENNKLMLYGHDSCDEYRKQRLMIYDSETTSSHEVSNSTGGFRTTPLCYFPSLISIL